MGESEVPLAGFYDYRLVVLSRVGTRSPHLMRPWILAHELPLHMDD